VLQLNNGIRERAVELLDRVGLSTKSRSFVRQMSQGERQRTAVCRSLVTGPKILICDEPTANLDSDNRDLVIDALLEYREKEQVSLIVVTHDSEVQNRFDTILDMRTDMP
jgi:putative ABC transport system ATP-binding protein